MVLELARSTTITKFDGANGSESNFKVEYEEIENDLDDAIVLGFGQFGIVRKVFHKPSNTWFAVKVILSNRTKQVLDLLFKILSFQNR